jgi:hypothetical protein
MIESKRFKDTLDATLLSSAFRNARIVPNGMPAPCPMSDFGEEFSFPWLQSGAETRIAIELDSFISGLPVAPKKGQVAVFRGSPVEIQFTSQPDFTQCCSFHSIAGCISKDRADELGLKPYLPLGPIAPSRVAPAEEAALPGRPCIECRYHVAKEGSEYKADPSTMVHYCNRPPAVRTAENFDPVTGEYKTVAGNRFECYTQRSSMASGCGFEGRFFSPKNHQ